MPVYRSSSDERLLRRFMTHGLKIIDSGNG
jgi:hypothetical protein